SGEGAVARGIDSGETYTPILHVSVDVADLERSIDFYTSIFGCALGRRRDDFADLWLFGCQLTLVRNASLELQSARVGPHFGVIVDADTFKELSRRVLGDSRTTIISPTTSANVGTALE